MMLTTSGGETTMSIFSGFFNLQFPLQKIAGVTFYMKMAIVMITDEQNCYENIS